jgi:hypothetical protein
MRPKIPPNVKGQKTRKPKRPHGGSSSPGSVPSVHDDGGFDEYVHTDCASRTEKRMLDLQ